MIKEFFFTENPDKWESFVEVHPDMLEDYLRFTTSNLITEDSAALKDLKNASSGSQILAPNNSSVDSEQDMYFFLPADVVKVDKLKEIEFSRQACRADIEYEMNHNQNVDKGVYTDAVDFKSLAVISGIKNPESLDLSQAPAAEANEVSKVQKANQPVTSNRGLFARGVSQVEPF